MKFKNVATAAGAVAYIYVAVIHVDAAYEEGVQIKPLRNRRELAVEACAYGAVWPIWWIRFPVYAALDGVSDARQSLKRWIHGPQKSKNKKK